MVLGLFGQSWGGTLPPAPGAEVTLCPAGKEAQLVQEKMDSLRMRFLIVSQSGSSILHRLEQTVEASCQLGPAQEDLALWLDRLERELSLQGSCLGDRPSPLRTADREKFEQVLRSELAKVAQLNAHLEELGQVHLDAPAICSQLAALKLLSAEILHHHGLVERLMAIADPLLSLCPPELQEELQPLAQPLREQTERLLHQSSACGVRLERAQLLLAQYEDAYQELCPWLEETSRAAGQLSLNSISCEAFKEHQELVVSGRPLLNTSP
ncbi:microtubule-actin cross-linking factor 1, isoforms 6/7-like [Rhineura floridana]|uniref:microtubule-actin cross-linking factor 1, isoforms 6/7-like n=1 Tax=Rhineura floridana TaxID=261503 RepID=UPI002AC8622E|nr:microtubule-actin cross-linking factor 1, isoforms 6/7-like [Rhineura floridana]